MFLNSLSPSLPTAQSLVGILTQKTLDQVKGRFAYVEMLSFEVFLVNLR